MSHWTDKGDEVTVNGDVNIAEPLTVDGTVAVSSISDPVVVSSVSSTVTVAGSVSAAVTGSVSLSNLISPQIAQAEREILATYGDTVSVVQKAKSLQKFGRNEALGTSLETVWEVGGNETYATTDAIDTISSSDAADTAVEITIEGHTVTGTGTSSQFAFVTQTATLNGQNKVTLTTPLARCSHMFVSGSTEPLGDVNVYQDTAIVGGVPSDVTKIHNVILGTIGQTQTFKAATTFSDSDYFIATGGWATVTKKTAAQVDFILEVRMPGGVFRPATGRIALDGDATVTQQIVFDPYPIVPKNSDIRIRASASTTGVEVDAVFMGYLALVVS